MYNPNLAREVPPGSAADTAAGAGSADDMPASNWPSGTYSMDATAPMPAFDGNPFLPEWWTTAPAHERVRAAWAMGSHLHTHWKPRMPHVPRASHASASDVKSEAFTSTFMEALGCSPLSVDMSTGGMFTLCDVFALLADECMLPAHRNAVFALKLHQTTAAPPPYTYQSSAVSRALRRVGPSMAAFAERGVVPTADDVVSATLAVNAEKIDIAAAVAEQAVARWTVNDNFHLYSRRDALIVACELALAALVTRPSERGGLVSDDAAALLVLELGVELSEVVARQVIAAATTDPEAFIDAMAAGRGPEFKQAMNIALARATLFTCETMGTHVLPSVPRSHYSARYGDRRLHSPFADTCAMVSETLPPPDDEVTAAYVASKLRVLQRRIGIAQVAAPAFVNTLAQVTSAFDFTVHPRGGLVCFAALSQRAVAVCDAAAKALPPPPAVPPRDGMPCLGLFAALCHRNGAGVSPAELLRLATRLRFASDTPPANPVVSARLCHIVSTAGPDGDPFKERIRWNGAQPSLASVLWHVFIGRAAARTPAGCSLRECCNPFHVPEAAAEFAAFVTHKHETK